MLRTSRLAARNYPSLPLREALGFQHLDEREQCRLAQFRHAMAPLESRPLTKEWRNSIWARLIDEAAACKILNSSSSCFAFDAATPFWRIRNDDLSRVPGRRNVILIANPIRKRTGDGPVASNQAA